MKRTIILILWTVLVVWLVSVAAAVELPAGTNVVKTSAFSFEALRVKSLGGGPALVRIYDADSSNLTKVSTNRLRLVTTASTNHPSNLVTVTNWLQPRIGFTASPAAWTVYFPDNPATFRRGVVVVTTQPIDVRVKQ